MSEGSWEAVRADDEVLGAAEARDLRRHVHELQRVLGKKTKEIQILHDAVRIADAKTTDVALAVASQRRYPMKTVCRRSICSSEAD